MGREGEATITYIGEKLGQEVDHLQVEPWSNTRGGYWKILESDNYTSM